MEKQWYFNTVTEQPELGMISPNQEIHCALFQTRDVPV